MNIYDYKVLCKRKVSIGKSVSILPSSFYALFSRLCVVVAFDLQLYPIAKCQHDDLLTIAH